MTIGLRVYYIDERTGERQYIDFEPTTDLASEASRYKLWGTDVMKELGLTLLPPLKESDIDVADEELITLECEARTILAHLDRVLEGVPYGEDAIVRSTLRIINAVKKAREVKGRVSIS